MAHRVPAIDVRPGTQPAGGHPVPGQSLVERDIGNLAAADLGQVTRAVKRKLKMLRYRPEAIDGCLACTGLTLSA